MYIYIYIPQVKHPPHDSLQSQAENDPAGVTPGATAGAPSTGAAASAPVAAGAVSLAYAGTQDCKHRESEGLQQR